VLSFAPQSIDHIQVVEFFARILSDVFRIAVTLAFPIGLVCLLADVAFGLLNRVAPQINAYFMSMPAKAAGGMVIFLAAFSMIAEQFVRYGHQFLDTVRHVLDVLR
jgi:flagellar biosynthesis protein FliR